MKTLDQVWVIMLAGDIFGGVWLDLDEICKQCDSYNSGLVSYDPENPTYTISTLKDAIEILKDNARESGFDSGVNQSNWSY